MGLLGLGIQISARGDGQFDIDSGGVIGGAEFGLGSERVDSGRAQGRDLWIFLRVLSFGEALGAFHFIMQGGQFRPLIESLLDKSLR